MTSADEEMAVLGACLQSSGAWAEVCDYLYENNFAQEEHRLIWRAMVYLHNEGSPIDEISVAGILRQKKALTKAGGAVYISRLADSLPDLSSVTYYAQQVKANSNARKLKGLGSYLSTSDESPEEIISKAYIELSDIAKKSVKSKIVSVGDSTDGFLQELFDENGHKEEPIRTGFSELDGYLWGLQPEDFFVLAARPSIGKTAFSMQVATNMARQNRRVLFLSLEMATQQLTRRLLSMESGVPYQRILKSQYLSKDNKQALSEAADRIRTLPLDIDDTAGQRLGAVRMKAQQIKASKSLDVVMVDHIQLLSGGEIPEEVTKVSNGLKALAKDLNIVVWGISQLSRNIEYRESRKPQLSDLRGSGSLEQDADAVAFMWHPHKGQKDKIEIVLEKHRNGPLGACTLHFDRDTTRFSTGGW